MAFFRDLLLLSAVGMLACSGAASAQTDRRSSDFNGDGFDDLAIGIPGQVVEGRRLAGQVRVLFGSGDGLSPDGSVLIDSRALGDETSDPEQFGAALAVGDFNGDGFMDLAIGAPLYTQPGATTAGHGRVAVFFGAPTAFGAQGIELGLNEGSRPAQFGKALATGDVDDDGFDELLVGAPNALNGRGAAVLYFGSAEGLSRLDANGMGVNPLTYNTFGRPGRTAELLGTAMVIADLLGSDRADLVVGIPDSGSTPPQGVDDGGEIGVVTAADSGSLIASDGAQIIHQDTPSVAGQKEPNDEFGSSIVAGRFGTDARYGLAVGVPAESFENPGGTISGAGIVNVFPSLAAPGSRDLMLHQDVDGVGGQAESGDRFGAAIGVGDFNGDERDDLVIGVPRENFTGFDRAGVAHVMYGPITSPAPRFQQLWHHDSPGIAHGVDVGDDFGAAIGTGDFNHDGFQDLALGAPGEQLGGEDNAGGVLILYGGQRGLTTRDSQFWTEDQPEFRSRALANAGFGAALSNAALRPSDIPLTHTPVDPTREFDSHVVIEQ